jgi:hypothetical protein
MLVQISSGHIKSKTHFKKEEVLSPKNQKLMVSLGTSFFQGIPIFPRENELISLRKIEIL